MTEIKTYVWHSEGMDGYPIEDGYDDEYYVRHDDHQRAVAEAVAAERARVVRHLRYLGSRPPYYAAYLHAADSIAAGEHLK